MARRLRILWTFLLTLGSVAAWTELELLGLGMLVHAQLQFVAAWALTLAWWCWKGGQLGRFVAAVGLVAHFGLYSQPFWAAAPRATGPGQELRAVWFNAWGSPSATEALHHAAVEKGADLVALCQAGGAPVLRRLAADYPYQAYDHDDRIGLFSRVPIAEVEWLEGEPGHKPRERKWLRVVLEGGVEVWVGHAQHPDQTAHAPTLTRIRAAAERAGPAVLFADLNTTPWAAGFQSCLAAGWQSARAGQWPWRTWRDPSFPLLRWPIDHVLVRGGVGVTAFTVGSDLGSDHLPLWVDLVLPALP
ncbi:MAG: hypothetical protein CMJ94_03590 [Planctomycetes bacterium]|nr:hypothetical protein [Planctomycetota bacterium]